MVEVQFPEWRADVVAGLARLATITPANLGEWPDLTNAIHWLVDDTRWGQRSPYDDVGHLLVDVEEAGAVQAALDPLLVVLNELGPSAPDRRYLEHAAWATLTERALEAQQLLERNDA